MKKACFLLIASCFLQNLFSQELKQNVIAADGGISTAGNISLEWTLGEFAVETISTDKNLYTQGFHQPVLTVKKLNSFPGQDLFNENNSGYNVLLAPNPAKSFVNVYMESEKNENHLFSLYDLSGKRILVKQGSGNDYTFRINLEHLASAVYLLDIRDKNGKLIRAFKIIKAQ